MSKYSQCEGCDCSAYEECDIRIKIERDNLKKRLASSALRNGLMEKERDKYKAMCDGLWRSLEKCVLYTSPLVACEPPVQGAGMNIIKVVNSALAKWQQMQGEDSDV